MRINEDNGIQSMDHRVDLKVLIETLLMSLMTIFIRIRVGPIIRLSLQGPQGKGKEII